MADEDNPQFVALQAAHGPVNYGYVEKIDGIYTANASSHLSFPNHYIEGGHSITVVFNAPDAVLTFDPTTDIGYHVEQEVVAIGQNEYTRCTYTALPN